MNVPSPNERTIRRDIAASDISLDAAIQVYTKIPFNHCSKILLHDFEGFSLG